MDNKDIHLQISNDLTEKLVLTKAYYDFFQNAQVSQTTE